MTKKPCVINGQAEVRGKFYNEDQYIAEQARLKKEGLDDSDFSTPFGQLPKCEPDDPEPDSSNPFEIKDPSPFD